jgi:hypothetical protein
MLPVVSDEDCVPVDCLDEDDDDDDDEDALGDGGRRPSVKICNDIIYLCLCGSHLALQ